MRLGEPPEERPEPDEDGDDEPPERDDYYDCDDEADRYERGLEARMARREWA